MEDFCCREAKVIIQLWFLNLMDLSIQLPLLFSYQMLILEKKFGKGLKSNPMKLVISLE